MQGQTVIRVVSEAFEGKFATAIAVSTGRNGLTLSSGIDLERQVFRVDCMPLWHGKMSFYFLPSWTWNVTYVTVDDKNIGAKWCISRAYTKN